MLLLSPRIRVDTMKIEHWHCQSRYPDEALDYANLLGACRGNEGQARGNQHCDTHKGDLDLSRNPADAASMVEELIRYRQDGTVASDDATLDRELNKVLNLNVPIFVSNRKDKVNRVVQLIRKRGSLSKTAIERLLEEWEGAATANELPEFSAVVVYWLRKGLRGI